MRDEDSGNTPTLNLLRSVQPRAKRGGAKEAPAEAAEAPPPALPSVEVDPSLLNQQPLWNRQTREAPTVQIQRPSTEELRKAAERLRASAPATGGRPRFAVGAAMAVVTAVACAALVTAALKLRGRVVSEPPTDDVPASAAATAPLATAIIPPPNVPAAASAVPGAVSVAAPTTSVTPPASSATVTSAATSPASAEPAAPPAIELPASAPVADQPAASGAPAIAAVKSPGPKVPAAEPTSPVAATPPVASGPPTASVESIVAAAQARQQGNAARARTIYRAILAKNPDDVDALTGLGDLARGAGKNTDARAFYEHALIVSPTHGPAVLGLADTLWDLDQRDAARQRYAELLRRGGPSAYPPRVETRGAQ